MKSYVNPTLELLKLEAEDVLSTLNSVANGGIGKVVDLDDIIAGN